MNIRIYVYPTVVIVVAIAAVSIFLAVGQGNSGAPTPGPVNPLSIKHQAQSDGDLPINVWKPDAPVFTSIISATPLIAQSKVRTDAGENGFIDFFPSQASTSDELLSVCRVLSGTEVLTLPDGIMEYENGSRVPLLRLEAGQVSCEHDESEFTFNEYLINTPGAEIAINNSMVRIIVEQDESTTIIVVEGRVTATSDRGETTEILEDEKAVQDLASGEFTKTTTNEEEQQENEDEKSAHENRDPPEPLPAPSPQTTVTVLPAVGVTVSRTATVAPPPTASPIPSPTPFETAAATSTIIPGSSAGDDDLTPIIIGGAATSEIAPTATVVQLPTPITTITPTPAIPVLDTPTPTVDPSPIPPETPTPTPISTPPAPELTSPGHRDNTNDRTPTFEWEAIPGTGSIQYEFQIDSSRSFSPPMFKETTTDSSITIPGNDELELDIYFWRVGTIKDEIPGPFSEIWELEIKSDSDGGGGGGGGSPPTPTPTPQPFSAAISEPVGGNQVAMSETVRGTMTGPIPEGKSSLWIVVSWQGLWWPQGSPITEPDWSVPAVIGMPEDGGTDFGILLVLTTADVDQAIFNWFDLGAQTGLFPGLISNNLLNLGVEIVDEIAVTRFFVTVSSENDGSDTDLSDGICDDGTGSCSLRAAIEQANAVSGPDAITFAGVTCSPICTFKLDSPLPEIVETLVVDGTTAPGYSDSPLIELDGSNAGAGAHGIFVSSDDTIVKGLMINNFDGSGIVLQGAGNSVIERNSIGTDADGTADLGNSSAGIAITSGSSDNTIQDNVIAHNGAGITITDGINESSTGNAIRSNSIFLNSGLGIDLGNDGSTPNDPRDGDASPNKFQNFPEISSAVLRASAMDVTYWIPSSPINSAYPIQVEFFETDLDGEEGQTLIGVDTYTAADAELERITSFVPLSSIAVDDIIVATATDSDGNTSEFSLPASVFYLKLTVDSTFDTADSSPGDALCDDGSGRCTLRAAIEEANASMGTDVVFFDLAGPGPHTIMPTSTLPRITDSLVIDGTTEPDFSGTPIVELDGTNAGAGADGFVINAQNSVIRGFVINRFNGTGIKLEGGGASGNRIEGNFVGTDLTGRTALSNSNGIWIKDAAFNNTIGAISPPGRNVVSGNARGILFTDEGTTGNVIVGNFIGVDVAGDAALGNLEDGILFQDVSNNLIGGTLVGSGNVISGNGKYGIQITEFSSTSTDTKIQGNFIGTDVSGTQAIGNTSAGVFINDSSGHVIGGTDTGARNVISGNTLQGVVILGLNAKDNLVQGNFIGTDVSGTLAIGNGSDGLGIQLGASSNIIGGSSAGSGNVISANSGNGVAIAGDGLGLATQLNSVQGNLIGVDATGSMDLGNGFRGILLTLGAPDNTIGGTIDTTPGGSCTGSCNVISGNNQEGILVAANVGFPGVQIQGNFIGTDITGQLAIGNDRDGISIFGVPNNTIGGITAHARNLISGNATAGIVIGGLGSADNVIEGNFIGTNTDGDSPLGNFTGIYIGEPPNNTIGGIDGTIPGGPCAGACNLISGNVGWGIQITADDPIPLKSNHILSNYIGIDVSGSFGIGNGFGGVAITSVDGNVIGGSQALAGNVISGNSGHGVSLDDSSGNTIQANKIGTDATGLLAVPNTGDGISILGDGNTIGGAEPGVLNTIAYNGGDGITVEGTGNVILLNSMFLNTGIGIDLDGDGITPNDPGDGDTGANNLQNFPEISFVVPNGSELNVTYRVLSSLVNSNYPIFVEFYKADADGEEGRSLVASDNYDVADAGLDKTVTISPQPAISIGDQVVAIATDAGGNSSEFSVAVLVAPLVTCPLLPGNTFAAQDLDGDGLCEDTSGNGIFGFDDVTNLFDNISSPEVQNNAALFDFNQNGFSDMDDVLVLFDMAVGTSDISMTKVVDNPNPNESDQITFTIVLTNNSTSTASDIVVDDQLPSEVTFVQSIGDGSYDPISGEWNIDSIAGLMSGTIDIIVTVNNGTAGVTFINTAQVMILDIISNANVTVK